jgi:hypothetical protein
VPAAKKSKKETTLSFKVTKELDLRLKDAAAVTKLTPSALAIAAVEAALAAIERDHAIVMPVEFLPRRIPHSATYPSIDEQRPLLAAEDPPAPEDLLRAAKHHAATVEGASAIRSESQAEIGRSDSSMSS